MEETKMDGIKCKIGQLNWYFLVRPFVPSWEKETFTILFCFAWTQWENKYILCTCVCVCECCCQLIAVLPIQILKDRNVIFFFWLVEFKFKYLIDYKAVKFN